MAKKKSNRSAREAIVAAAGVAAAAASRLGPPRVGGPPKIDLDKLNELEAEFAEDDEEDFGGEALDRELAADHAAANGLPPPPPPAPPTRFADQPSKPPETLVDLGPPPEDALAAQAWLHRAMVLSAADAMLDTEISAATRRRELRTIAIAADKLVPNRDLWEARELIKRDREALEQRARARTGAKLEGAPTSVSASANVIPIRPLRVTADGKLPNH